MDEVKYDEIINSDWNGYQPGDHQTIKRIIKQNINSVCANYVANGYYLNYVNDQKLYKEDGYSGIGEYAEAEYGIKKDKCSYLMKIAKKFCIPNSPVLLPEYKDFKVEKLREMVYLTDEQLEQVTLTTTRAEIRDMKKPEPEKVAPAQLIEVEPRIKNAIIRAYIESLPDWKKENIRKAFSESKSSQERVDYIKSCTALGQTKIFLENEEKSLYLRKAGEDELELSDWYHDSEEFAPGVNKLIFTYGDVAGIADGILYETNPESNFSSIKTCKYDGKSNCVAVCNTGAECCAECPNHENCNSECGWQEERIPKPELNGLPCDCKYNDEDNGNKCIYPGDCSLGKDMRAPKESKKQMPYTECVAYQFKNDCTGCYYDTNDCPYDRTGLRDESDEEETEPVMCRHKPEEICTKCNSYCLTEIPDTVTETDENVIAEPETVTEPEESINEECTKCKLNGNSDAGIMECHPERGEHVCWIGDEPEKPEIVEADVIQDEEPEESVDPEQYTYRDIDEELDKLMEYLDSFRADNVSVPARRKTKMRYDAIVLLDKEMRKPPIAEEPEPVQPELPILKNNDQRKEWIDNYTSWPVWIDLPQTGERFYRYDLDLGGKVAIVVKVSKKHHWKEYRETKDYEYSAEQYYLLGVKSEWSQKGSKFTVDESRTFYECNTNKSALVEYLKEIQKKGA